jgi:hypothetical protein
MIFAFHIIIYCIVFGGEERREGAIRKEEIVIPS